MNQWTEDDSRTFIDYGPLFVPNREEQIDIICRLLPAGGAPLRVLELCSGDGTLAAAVLEAHPEAILLGCDGSPEMLAKAAQTCAPFSDRFQTRRFDLAAHDWRTAVAAYAAVLSSLTIHHLDGPEKLRLFNDMYHMLAPGGVLIVADLILPAHPRGNALAAQAWDDEVRRRSRALTGDETAFTAFAAQKWNLFRYPDPEMDKPSPLYRQLQWMDQAGFQNVDVHWFRAGHVIFSGWKGVS